PSSVAPVEGDADAGARLVGDCMKGQQRLAHSPVLPLCQMLERDLSSLAEETPLLNQKIRDRTVPILDPHAPLLAGLVNCVGPARKATRRPFHTARRG